MAAKLVLAGLFIGFPDSKAMDVGPPSQDIKEVEIGKKTVRKFGKSLRVLSLAKGWSQEQLAEALNCDSTYISRVETGKRAPSLPMIGRIAHVLEVSVATLFEESSPDQKET